MGELRTGRSVLAWLIVAGVWPGVAFGALVARGYWGSRGTPDGARWPVSFVAGIAGFLAGGYWPLWLTLDSLGWPLLGQVLLGPLVFMALGARSHAVEPARGSAPAAVAGDGRPASAPRPAGVVRNGGAGRGVERSGDQGNGKRAMLLLGHQRGGRPFAVPLPAGLKRHLSILGNSGTGKTTTIIRVMKDALDAGYAVVVVDAKGTGSLRDASEALAGRSGVGFRVVDPTEPGTLRYNPARGTPAEVGNKLLGAFGYGSSGESFKRVAQMLVPLLTAALQQAGERVTLRTLAGAMNNKRMAELAGGMKKRAGAPRPESAREGLRVPVQVQPDREPVIFDAKELVEVISRESKLYPAALDNIHGRLKALRYGVYGRVFEIEEGADELDLAEAFGKGGGVTYVSLPAMAASEDSELMARVVIQDAKQAAAQRLAELRESGEAPPPALLVIDEFAALKEAEQINDLLLQARESGISVVLSTQILPQGEQLKTSFLSAGLLVCHKVGERAAREVAGAFGYRKGQSVTRHLSAVESGDEDGNGRFSASPTRMYEIEPDEIQKLGEGRAAVQLDYKDVRRVGVVKVAWPFEKEDEA